MVVVLITGSGLGWMSHRARRQREAVAAIQASRGRVLYEWERKNGNPVPKGRPGWPRWLVDRVGVDSFGNVVFVELGENGSDAEMIHVGRLHRLEELYLHVSAASHEPVSRLTDEGMRPVARLNRLRTMLLSSNRVGDVGLAHLKGLTGLNALTILMTQATPDGVASLRKSLPQLRITWYGCTTP